MLAGALGCVTSGSLSDRSGQLRHGREVCSPWRDDRTQRGVEPRQCLERRAGTSGSSPPRDDLHHVVLRRRRDPRGQLGTLSLVILQPPCVPRTTTLRAKPTVTSSPSKANCVPIFKERLGALGGAEQQRPVDAVVQRRDVHFVDDPERRLGTAQRCAASPSTRRCPARTTSSLLMAFPGRSVLSAQNFRRGISG